MYMVCVCCVRMRVRKNDRARWRRKGGGIRERERRNKNTMVRSPIGSVVPRRTVYAHLFFFFNFYFPQTKEAPIRWRWWPCARWSCILSQGQSVSRIQRLSFVSFLFHHRARRDTAAKKHRCIFPPEATTNCLRFLKHFNLVESICWNYSPRYIKGKQMTNISSVCFLIIKHVQVFSEWINENVRDRN